MHLSGYFEYEFQVQVLHSVDSQLFMLGVSLKRQRRRILVEKTNKQISRKAAEKLTLLNMYWYVFSDFFCSSTVCRLLITRNIERLIKYVFLYTSILSKFKILVS